MKRIFKTILLFIFLNVFIIINVYPDTEEIPAKPIILNKKFYSKFIKTEAIKRDLFFDEILNKILQARGIVEAVGTFKRYHRQVRIIINSEIKKPSIQFFIFTDNEEYLSILNKGDIFEFKGQFVIYTPLNSARDSYIFDIILEDGALVVK